MPDLQINGSEYRESSYSLQWRHNGRDGVSNHQPYDCLLDRLFRRISKKTPKIRVTGLCAGNSPVTGECPAQMASNAEMFPFDDVIMFFTIDATWGSFYWHGLTLFPAWIINHMPSKVWNEITHLFPNFNGAAVGVWEWISNFILHFMMDAITYPYTYHPWEAMGLRLLTIHDVPAVGVHQRLATWMHVRRWNQKYMPVL